MNIFGKYGQIAGILISIFGIVIVIWAVLQLKNSLTAYPTPKDNSQLITNGLYHFVRHPIYTGILLFCFGYAMYSQSIWRLIISLSLLILFNFKAKYEEKKLTEKFSDYPLYCKTTGRFFPKLFI